MIKARLKTVEQADPDWLCCEGLIELLARDDGRELELSDDVVSVTTRCSVCHEVLATIPCRKIVGKPLPGSTLMPMIFVDLDEGKDGVR